MISLTCRFEHDAKAAGLCEWAEPAGRLLYTYAGRAYHNLTHLADVHDVFDYLEERGKMPAEPSRVRFAAWYHDVVYNPTRSDNEAMSAVYAVNDLTLMGMEDWKVVDVVRMIMATKDHDAEGANLSMRCLFDADLSILATIWPLYVDYTHAIREEYSHVPMGEYRKGRIAVLESYLNRRQIYTLLGHEFEERARANISREIALLT